MTPTTDDHPALHRVRAVSRALSEAERLWKGLPSEYAMKVHLDALQDILGRMLRELPKPPPTQSAEPKGSPRAASASTIPGGFIRDLFDRLGYPDAVTIALLREAATKHEGPVLSRAKGRAIPDLMAQVGYERTDNPTSANGSWALSYGQVIIYTRRDLAQGQRLAAAKAFAAAEKVGAAAEKMQNAQPGNRAGSCEFSVSGISPPTPAGTAEPKELGQ